MGALDKLWLPSLAAPPSGPFLPAGTFDSTSWGSPQSISLPGGYTTKLNDLIVFCWATSGSNVPTISGCGATWVITQVDVGPNTGMAIGYGCTAGGTAISVGSLGGVTGSACLAVNSGNFGSGNPITGTPNNSMVFNFNSGSTNTVNSSTNGATNPSPHELIIPSYGGGGNWGATLPSWGSLGGVTAGPANLAIDNNNRACRLDYTVATGAQAGANVTYTATGNAQLSCAFVFLKTTTP